MYCSWTVSSWHNKFVVLTFSFKEGFYESRGLFVVRMICTSSSASLCQLWATLLFGWSKQHHLAWIPEQHRHTLLYTLASTSDESISSSKNGKNIKYRSGRLCHLTLFETLLPTGYSWLVQLSLFFSIIGACWSPLEQRLSSNIHFQWERWLQPLDWLGGDVVINMQEWPPVRIASAEISSLSVVPFLLSAYMSIDR